MTEIIVMLSKNQIGWRMALLAGLLGSAANATANVAVLTYHNDNARTGQNTNEAILTPANVGSGTQFGKIFSYPVDGYVYAQPLVMTNVAILGKSVHDVVYVATEHDSVYAFDASNFSGTNAVLLWQVSFINPAAGITTVASSDVACSDVVPEIGITSTPVIDAASGTIYVCAKTKEVTTSGTAYYHRLHALDLATGAEKFGGPALVQATQPGTGDGNDGAGQVPFNPLTQFNRAALLLSQGVVYMGSAAHCDNGPYHGWLVGYGAQTLTLSNVFITTPNGSDGGIWQAGGGPACDASNNIYVVTGNGTFDTNLPGVDYGDSFLKLSTTINGLQLADYFTPYNQQALSDEDLDLGSGGALVLPDEAGDGAANQHLLVGSGKEGSIYLINRDNMQHYNPADNSQIVQFLPGAIGGGFDTPAYFNQQIYYIGANDTVKAFTITNATIAPDLASQGTGSYGFPGATPSISANGTNDAIVWALQTDAYQSSGPAVLHAYAATNVGIELYNSAAAGTRDIPGGAVKFAVPTIANGKVYVGAQYSLTVYGLGNFLPAPVICPAGGTFTNSISVALTNAVPGASIRYTLDGSAPNAGSPLYAGPLVITNTVNLQAQAFQAGAQASQVAAAVYWNSADFGTGIGLTGAYFSNQLRTLISPATLVRTDAVVNFYWTDSSPDPTVSTMDFSVIWTGTVQAQFSEPYTFYTTTDDGVRLWVNGQLLVDKWVDQAATEWSGTLLLQAGQKYSIVMEYYQNGGGASAQLAWSSPSTAKNIIPQSQLYPATPTSAAIGNGTGLAGAYYANQLRTFTNPPTLLRTDATVDFNWNNNSPDSSIGLDDFSVIWTGTVLAQFSEPYTFYTTTDDGVRLWVNGQLLVDKWVDQAATEWSGGIFLQAGTQYPITVEYYQNGGDALAQLAWSSPSTAKIVIPQSQLHPYCPPVILSGAGEASNGLFNLQMSGLVGKGYVLQATTNLTTWVSIQTNMPNPDPNVMLPTNQFDFTAPNLTNFPQRFYRTVQLP